MASKHLVLVGGGHAHMVTLANLKKFVEMGHRVSVIGPSMHHYYSGMGPGMLSNIYAPDEIRFATRHVVEKQGCQFILGKVTHVDPKERIVFLESGVKMTYDVLSFNAGSYIPPIGVPEKGGEYSDVFSVKPIEKLQQAQKRILALVSERQIRIGITGGGAAAVEVAGNVWRLCRDSGRRMPLIQLFTGKKFMARYHEKIQRLARRSLEKRGIEIVADGYVREVKSGQLTLDNRKPYPLDFIFLAHGVKPSPIFSASGVPCGPDGGLLVNKFLQSTQYPEIFGGGDCIYFRDRPLDKVGVYAVRENPVLYHNLMAALEGAALKPFDPGGDFLIILNMGDGSGILMKKRMIFRGRLAFVIKDYIDRKFMKKFQAME